VPTNRQPFSWPAYRQSVSPGRDAGGGYVTVTQVESQQICIGFFIEWSSMARGHCASGLRDAASVLRRLPRRQCRMAATFTPQIWAFSRSRTSRPDNSKARSTVQRGCMGPLSPSPLTAERPHTGAGSGIRTRTPFRADAFETSMSASSIIPACVFGLNMPWIEPTSESADSADWSTGAQEASGLPAAPGGSG
jgi:hypothetical protein